jgi:tRNA(fMet)-specific endonuclease VapC
VIFLLDTNVCIDLIREKDTPVSTAFLGAVLQGRKLVLSSITAYELEIGVIRRGRKPRDVAATRDFFNGPIESVDFDLSASRKAAALCARLLTEGRQLSAYDGLIAGHAIALGATLVTADGKLTEAVSEIEVVSWR